MRRALEAHSPLWRALRASQPPRLRLLQPVSGFYWWWRNATPPTPTGGLWGYYCSPYFPSERGTALLSMPLSAGFYWWWRNATPPTPTGGLWGYY